jgi:hypothetical protein
VGDPTEPGAIEDQVGHRDGTTFENPGLAEHSAQRRLPRAVAADELDDHRISL